VLMLILKKKKKKKKKKANKMCCSVLRGWARGFRRATPNRMPEDVTQQKEKGGGQGEKE